MTSYINNPSSVDIVKAIFTPYTSTGFNSSQSGIGTNTNSYESDDIPALNLTTKNYVLIYVTCNTNVNGSGSHSSQCSLKIECKDLSGSYTTDYNNVVNGPNSSSYSNGDAHTFTIVICHTITANERNLGMKIKFTSTSINNGAGDSASFSNQNTFAIAIQ